MAAQQGFPGEGFPGGGSPGGGSPGSGSPSGFPGGFPGAGFPGEPGPPSATDPARPIYGDWVPPTTAPPPAGPPSGDATPPTAPPYGAPTPPQYGAPPRYGVPTQPTYGVPTPPTVPSRRRRFRKRHGFLGLLVIFLILALIQVLVAPWAVHIGGSFTPLGNWSGAAQGKAPNGDRYAVELKLNTYLIFDRDHACSQTGGCDDFHGTMTVCTKAGRYTLQNVSGRVGGWLSTDGQDMRISFAPGRGNKAYQQLLQVIGTLHGTWHGKVYQATDGGYLERDFKPEGTPRTVVTSPDPKQAVALAFQPVNFDAMCAALKPA